MYDITLHAMVNAYQPKERFSKEEMETLEYIKKLMVYRENRDKYCRVHKAITRQEYNVCADCAWKYYCNHSVGKVR